MAIALVQSKVGGNGSGPTSATSNAVGYNATTTAGNLLVCVVSAQDDVDIPAISTPVTTGFTWSLLNTATYQDVGNSLYGRVSHYYIANAGAMSATTRVTATQNRATFIQVEFALYEFSGVAQTTPLDISATSSNGSSSVPSTANLSTTATDLIFVSMATSSLSAGSAGSGFTLGVSAPAIESWQSQYILNQSSGSIATAFGTSKPHWGCAAVSLKSAASGNASVSVTGVTFASAVGSASGTGTATVSVSGVSGTSAVGTATVTTGQSVTTTGVSMTASVGVAFATSSGATVATSGVSMSAAVHAPSPTGIGVVAVIGVSITASVGTTTVDATSPRLSFSSLTFHNSMNMSPLVASNRMQMAVSAANRMAVGGFSVGQD